MTKKDVQPAKIVSAAVHSIELLTQYVSRIRLAPDQSVSFLPGQYLQVVMGEGDKRPFSIASESGDSHIELHIGAAPDNPYATEVIAKCRQEGKLDIELPCGNAFWQSKSGVHNILLAGGTGYSYVRSILFSALKQASDTEAFTLYWGARTKQDLYEFEQLQTLAEQYDNVTFVPVVEKPEADWSGKTGLVHEAVLADVGQFESQRVYVAGRFEMAKVVKGSFIEAGLAADHLIGDAFAYID